MTKTYAIISVDATAKTMVVEFTQDGVMLTLNEPAPPTDVLLDQHIVNIWPTFAFAQRASIADVDAATAAIGNIVEITGTPPPPPPRLIDKLTIVDRLIAAGKIEAALSALASDAVTKARWDAAVHIDTTDPVVTGLLTAIGADPVAILAP
jgi:hypothetical protein